VRQTTLDRTWKAWSGELADLERLATLIGSLAEARKDEILSSLEEGMGLRGLWEGKEPVLKVKVVEGTDTITGPAQEVLSELDRRTVQSVEIFGDFVYPEELKVQLSKNKGENWRRWGVRLQLASTNPGWAKRCAAQVSEEVEKSVPWWAWFWTVPGIVISYVAACVLAVVVVLLVALRHTNNTGSAAIISLNGFSIATIFAWTLGPRLWRWTFPRFEVHSEGAQPTGGRRMAAFGSIAAAFLVAILVNYIT